MTANLAFPGAGSLAAGKSVGYAQLVLCTIGFIVSGVACALAVKWFLVTGSHESENDPGTFLIDVWRHLFWPLTGMGIFLVALVWAYITGATNIG